MEFNFITRANTVFGAGCVKKNADKWVLGRRAFIVTGSKSGRLSGALSDVEDSLSLRGVQFETFEGVENNPSIEQCRHITNMAKKFNADFIVAIGGGSPIDAAKAVAVLAINKITDDELFTNRFHSSLPVVAIPTTSGTGSEVTPWSVLTRHSVNNKQSFGNALTLPEFALLDPEYTRSLNKRVTLHTAMDAFTHCFESIMSVKATPVTDALNAEALRRFAPCMKAIEEDKHEEVRDELMLISMLGGMTIAHTGTTLMHGMGYPFTYYKGLTHGEANCLVMLSALPLLEKEAPERVSYALGALGLGVDELLSYVKRNMPFNIETEDREIKSFTSLSMPQGSLRNTPCVLTEEVVERLYKDALACLKRS